jgi:hypothetical protein
MTDCRGVRAPNWGFDRRPLTGHLQSDRARPNPIDSTHDSEVSTHKPEGIRDSPACSVVADGFQRSQVQILSPLPNSGSEITISEPESFSRFDHQDTNRTETLSKSPFRTAAGDLRRSYWSWTPKPPSAVFNR